MLYLILVQSVRLKCFILISSRDIPVDKRCSIISVVVSDVSAEQLVMKNFAIWLSWRGPGDQKSGLQVTERARLQVQQWRWLSSRGRFQRKYRCPLAGRTAERGASFHSHFIPAITSIINHHRLCKHIHPIRGFTISTFLKYKGKKIYIWQLNHDDLIMWFLTQTHESVYLNHSFIATVILMVSHGLVFPVSSLQGSPGFWFAAQVKDF